MQDVLFLAQRIPYPPNKGDKIRSFHVLQDLTRHCRVHLGCFIDDPDDWTHLPMLREMVASSCVLPLSRRRATLRSTRALLRGDPMSVPYYYDRRMAEWVDSLMAATRPETAYLFSSPMAQYVMKSVRPNRVVMDFVDVDSQKWMDYASGRKWPLAPIYRRESGTLLTFERQVAQLADASIFVSGPERDLFQSLAPDTAGRIHAISNGIDSVYFSPHRDYPAPFDRAHPTLVFAGAMDYWPNVEAIRWFTMAVLPLLRRTIPDARLVIVGVNPTPDVVALGNIAGVTVTGRVPDMRPYLAHANAIVAPLLTARGIQNKVLEGMSMARPVVATSQAHEGIEATPGRHLLVADGASDFAAATARAMIDPLGTAIGSAARALILKFYGWEPQLARFRGLVLNKPGLDAA
jgi:sugar transferase (PEP-CTERM/EpsH1 system associated)